MNEETIELEIDERFEGDRLDRTLTTLLDDRSRALIQKHIELGAVTIDGAAPTRGAKTKMRAGMSISYRPPPPEPITLEPENIPLTVLFEDEHLLVVDKQPNLVVHPGAGHPRGTLVNAVLFHLGHRLDGVGPPERPGIVHRLDRDTTGAMVIAKSARCHELLSRAFAEREVEKEYLAVAAGVTPPKGTFDTFYGRHPRDRKRFSSRVESGKRAVTHYVRTEAFDDASLVEVRLETGRTHQIRVHFADAGHALVGDRVYAKRLRIEFERPALHARRLAFRHPMVPRDVECVAPTPADLAALISRLQSG